MAQKQGGKSAVLRQLRTKIKSKGREGALLCVCLSTAAGIAVMFLLMCLFAAVLSSFPLPLSVFSPAGLLIGAMGSAASGFFCALLSREKGFFYGLFCGMILFLILVIVALLAWQQKVGTYSLIKFFTMLLCGALGGSIGVNAA